MVKSLVWSGIALFVLGAGVFLLFVLPGFGGSPSEPIPLNGPPSSGYSVLAVTVSSLSLAAGAALFGIGLGRWRRPKASPYDGSPEI
jgi:hypothetical protein